MDNGIYIALSRQLALFRDMDVTANNIANTNTTGYNAEHLLFNAYMTKDVNQGKPNPMAMAYNISSYRKTETGSMKVTGNDLDVAIQGDGYFTVETPLGIRYTRAGNFQLDGTGTLSTPEGYAVLDSAAQRIIMPENTTSVTVGEAGNIKVNGEDFANLGVAQFENQQLLERLNARIYKSDIPAQPAVNFRVVQGMLENANTQPVIELTRMMKLTRATADTSQFIGVMYDLERKASNAWARQG